MKFKIILIILIATIMNNYAYSYAGNCNNNLNKQGYVTAVFLGVDDNEDARVTFSFNPINSKDTITISLYNYITGTDNKVTFDSKASKNARAAYSLLLMAFSSGRPVKIMRCHSDGVVGIGLIRS